jgi:predicted transcriptional regulator
MTQTEYEQNIIKKANARSEGTWDIYFEIDCDCEELLDAIGIDYVQCEDDDTQNEVAVSLDKDEYCDVFETIQFLKLNEQVIASRVLNHELAEYTTKATIYTPSGDKITFS